MLRARGSGRRKTKRRGATVSMTSGGALRAPRTRFGLSVVLSFVLAGGALTAIPIVFDAEAAHAEYAAGGSGRLLDSLDWFEWGEPDAAIPAEGATRTNTRVIDGQTLATTCTVSNITGGPLSAYRPGDWAGDALDDLYNVGGTDGANQLVAGLSNLDSGDTIDFRFSCAVTLDGVAVPLRGLVVADAEASNWPNGAEPGTFPEYIQATPRQLAVWRIIDRYTAADCATDGLGLLSADNTLRLRPDGRECFFSTGEPGSDGRRFHGRRDQCRHSDQGGKTQCDRARRDAPDRLRRRSFELRRGRRAVRADVAGWHDARGRDRDLLGFVRTRDAGDSPTRDSARPSTLSLCTRAARTHWVTTSTGTRRPMKTRSIRSACSR